MLLYTQALHFFKDTGNVEGLPLCKSEICILYEALTNNTSLKKFKCPKQNTFSLLCYAVAMDERHIEGYVVLI